MRWWGWGEPAQPMTVSDAGSRFILGRVGMTGWASRRPVDLDAVRLPDPAVSDDVVRALREAVGDDHVLLDRASRVGHAAGRSYPDLVRLRAGGLDVAPDAVVSPGSDEEVARVLSICDREGVAIVPFGGGTSVVGGVDALRGGFDAAISLDLARLDRLETDARSLTATLGAGLPLRTAEAKLEARGFTLGHFPQSFEFASIGGCVATRSAGQASTGYGRIDELVVGLRMVAPAGTAEVRTVPASAAGPSIRELLVGSEGALGVITEATLDVRPLPDARRYEGWSFRGFAAGVEAFRGLEQEHGRPDIARLSDEEETELAVALSNTGSAGDRAARAYLKARGHGRGCLVILGFEGNERDVAGRAARCRGILRAHGGLSLGRNPGRAWVRTRYLAPYLRDVLIDGGLLVETLETASTWSRLEELHAAVGDALRGSLAEPGTRPIVGCHVSHLYPSGASLYFTFMARAHEGAELDQWRAAKEAAMRTILDHGGTITHHHAVGRDHAPWMREEIGELGVAALRAAKERFDPNGIMNPGKLLPEDG